MASKKGSKVPSKTMLNPNEVIYQAVIILDSYNSRFYPLTKYSPRVLFPLVNVPVLQYTLSALNASGIQTVYLFCTDHVDDIKEFIRNSKWGSSSSPMNITLIVSKQCLTFGDALREIDNKGLIRSEFVLLTGDVIANVQLKKYIDEFRERNKRDKNMVMTMLCKKAAPKHRIRHQDEDCVYIVDDDTQRVFHYQKLGCVRKANLPLSIFSDNGKVSVRYDLLGCHMSICSPQVLPLFSDNFDFQTRDDFVKGILENEEILGNSIYLQVLEEEYAARVFNFHTYNALSKDVIERWLYPFVLDFDTLELAKPYSYSRNNIYLQKDVSLSKKCELKRGLVIGSESKIGDESKISQSVIGHRCVIGNNVTISNSYLWDDVVVEDNCVIESSLLASNVHLFKDVELKAGCILSPKVEIGPSVTLREGTLWTAKPLTDDDFDDTKINIVGVDRNVVGMHGKAYQYVGTDEEMNALAYHMKNFALCDDDDDNLSDTASSASEMMSEDDHHGLMDDSKQFFKEVLDSLARAIEEKIPSDNVILEINSSKHAYNISVKEVNMFVTKAILNMPAHEDQSIPPKEYFKHLRPVIVQFIQLLRNYIKSSSSQIDCLNAMEEYAITHQEFSAALMITMRFLYEKEILSEEAILAWYQEPPMEMDDTKGHETIRKLVDPFVNWLQEAEEESEEESD